MNTNMDSSNKTKSLMKILKQLCKSFNKTINSGSTIYVFEQLAISKNIRIDIICICTSKDIYLKFTLNKPVFVE